MADPIPMKTLCLIFVLAAAVSGQIKRPEPPAVKMPYSQSLQAVVVTTDGWPDTKGEARLYERSDTGSKWKAVGKEFNVVVGRSGLGWSKDLAPAGFTEFKKEGDGKSPAGMFPLTFAFGKPDSVDSKLSYQKLTEFTECVDDVNSSFYNRIAHRLQVGNFDWKSSEKMASITPEYDLGVFVAYNSYPVIKGNGSCIFLHIWKNADTPTSGCTAMARTDLERIVSWLDPKKDPYLIQLPEQTYKDHRRSWNLPKHN